MLANILNIPPPTNPPRRTPHNSERKPWSLTWPGRPALISIPRPLWSLLHSRSPGSASSPGFLLPPPPALALTVPLRHRPRPPRKTSAELGTSLPSGPSSKPPSQESLPVPAFFISICCSLNILFYFSVSLWSLPSVITQAPLGQRFLSMSFFSTPVAPASGTCLALALGNQLLNKRMTKQNEKPSIFDL